MQNNPKFIEIASNEVRLCPICTDGNVGPLGEPRTFEEQKNHAVWHGYVPEAEITEKDSLTGKEFTIARFTRKSPSDCHI